MAELKKPSAQGAVVSSLALVILFIMLAQEKREKSDAEGIVYSFLLLGFAASIIWAWLKYIKEYVNFAIEQKLKEKNSRPEA